MNNKVSGNNKKDFSEMTKAQRHQGLLEMSEEEIDYSDIAPLDDEFLLNAKQVENPLLREGKTVRIKSEVIKWFRSQAQSQNYERLINDVLESYMKEHQGK